jgi:hypothetical protein
LVRVKETLNMQNTKYKTAKCSLECANRGKNEWEKLNFEVRHPQTHKSPTQQVNSNT